jgi:hypothetical protein
MVASKFLIAYDGSDLGNKALNKGMELARLIPSVEIVVLYIISAVPLFAEPFVPIDDLIRHCLAP